MWLQIERRVVVAEKKNRCCVPRRSEHGKDGPHRDHKCTIICRIFVTRLISDELDWLSEMGTDCDYVMFAIH